MEVKGRVLIFATQKNVELLCRSNTWFLDGTFKVSATIFTQLFTKTGLWNSIQAKREDTPLPFVYALLSSKKQVQYKTVLQAVKYAVAQYRFFHCVPHKMMTNFEKGIINATQEIFPKIQIAHCFFHLGRLVNRQVQDKGLQQAYNDPDNHNIKTFIHMLLALAYVPIARVQATFELLV